MKDKVFRITTEPFMVDANDEHEAISSWFQMIQFIGFFIQEYQGAEPIGTKENRRLVIAENSTGGQLIISVKDEKHADMIQPNQKLRKLIEAKIKEIKEMDNDEWVNYNPEIDEELQQLLDKSMEKENALS